MNEFFKNLNVGEALIKSLKQAIKFEKGKVYLRTSKVSNDVDSDFESEEEKREWEQMMIESKRREESKEGD